MKEVYEGAEVEIIRFDSEDIITSSSSVSPSGNEGEPDDDF